MSRILPYGESALLVECRAEEVAPVFAVLATALPGAELVPGARTVLVRAPGRVAAVREVVSRLLPGPLPPLPVAAKGRTVVVPVRYDGDDLAEVARLSGLSPDGVVAAHTGRPWRVAFCGFAPGFAYLAGGDPRLVVARRPSPRTAVPAGAVGLAGEYSGVYPRPSPGGWQLIGRTDLVLWDPGRDQPALLRPGTRVRFEAVR